MKRQKGGAVVWEKKLSLMVFILLISMGIMYSQAMAATITVTSPHSGDGWCKRQEYTITWTTSGPVSAYVILDLYSSDGTTPIKPIASGIRTNRENFRWTIPTDIQNGTYVVRVRTIYVHTTPVVLGPVYDDSGPFIIRTCLQVPPLPMESVPRLILRRTPEMEFGDVEMNPQILTIRYGQNVVTINNGQRASIYLGRDCPDYFDGRTRELIATVEYSLRNTTSKNFRLHVDLSYENEWIPCSNEIVLSSNETKTIRHSVRLQAYPYEHVLRIMLQGSDWYTGRYPHHHLFAGLLSIEHYGL